jgi:hypothetical protein
MRSEVSVCNTKNTLVTIVNDIDIECINTTLLTEKTSSKFLYLKS